MATKEAIVPFTPPVAEETVETVSGEVITPEDELRVNERIIKRGWKAAQQKAAEVYRALTIIHTKNLWKQHLDADGKRKYNSFETYLFAEFEWKLDRTRALQIIAQERPKLLEAGVLKPEDMPKQRARTAPEVTATKAAEVTRKQLQTVQKAFDDRIINIANGPGADALDRIAEDLEMALAPIYTALQQVIDDEAAAAAAAAADAAAAATVGEALAEQINAEAEEEEVPTELSPLRA